MPKELAPLPKTSCAKAYHFADREALLAQVEKVRAAGFRVELVEEPDGDERWRGITAFAVEPSTRRNKLGKLFHGCKMLSIPDPRFPPA